MKVVATIFAVLLLLLGGGCCTLVFFLAIASGGEGKIVLLAIGLALWPFLGLFPLVLAVLILRWVAAGFRKLA